MNSILHILQNVDIFVEVIFKSKSKLDNTIHNSLKNLFKYSLSNEDISISPIDFKEIIGIRKSIWNENEQQDSQEFLNFLLTEIEEEIGENSNFIPGFSKDSIELVNTNITYTITNIITFNEWNKYNLKYNSALKNIFYGINQQISPCFYCNSSQMNSDIYSMIQLEIPESNSNIDLYDCLTNTIYNNEIDDTIKKCDFCGLKCKYKLETRLWKTPKILILHLKRFTSNLKKIKTNVVYPILNLNLIKYFNQISPYKNDSLYNLIGINIHEGMFGYGHYTSYLKNMFNSKWYYYNDDNPVINIENEEQLQNKNAYILFYKQQINTIPDHNI